MIRLAVTPTLLSYLAGGASPTRPTPAASAPISSGVTTGFLLVAAVAVLAAGASMASKVLDFVGRLVQVAMGFGATVIMIGAAAAVFGIIYVIHLIQTGLTAASG